MVPIWQVLEKLTIKEKLELSNLLSRNPELTSYLEKLFYKKLEAMKNKDEKCLNNVYNEEKEMVTKILSELIKENYE